MSVCDRLGFTPSHPPRQGRGRISGRPMVRTMPARRRDRLERSRKKWLGYVQRQGKGVGKVWSRPLCRRSNNSLTSPTKNSEHHTARRSPMICKSIGFLRFFHCIPKNSAVPSYSENQFSDTGRDGRKLMHVSAIVLAEGIATTETSL
jgi:hypothetical protein